MGWQHNISKNYVLQVGCASIQRYCHVKQINFELLRDFQLPVGQFACFGCFLGALEMILEGFLKLSRSILGVVLEQAV